MTIGTFLDNCITDVTRLSIEDQKGGKMYEGTVRSFKIDDDDTGLKSELATRKIVVIKFDLKVCGFASHSRYEPLVTVVI